MQLNTKSSYAKCFILKWEGIIEKNSYERCVHESVDAISIKGYISKIDGRKQLGL